MQIIALLLSCNALAVGPAILDDLLSFSGQGMPRETEADCKAAGKILAEKLAKLSFQSIVTSCQGTNQDVGGFIPVLKARHSGKFLTEQTIGKRVYDPGAAQKCMDEELRKLTQGLPKEELLEEECLKGRETDYRGRSKTFQQAWLTKLRPDPKAKAKVETEQRANKSGAAPAAVKPPAPVTGKTGTPAQ